MSNVCGEFSLFHSGVTFKTSKALIFPDFFFELMAIVFDLIQDLLIHFGSCIINYIMLTCMDLTYKIGGGDIL
ncbi:MAG TPA: hypothetical protein VF941_00150, partial [Clostridia bacterium]